MPKPNLWALLVLAALASPAAAARAPAAPSTTDYAATVTRDKAVFSFPLDTRGPFQWDRPTDPAGAMEYRWTVEVNDGGASYAVGYFKTKSAAADAAQVGDLEDLLKAGQLGVFRKDDQGRYTQVDGQVGVDVRSGLLILTISGLEDVDRLLSARPSSVTFDATTPGAAPDIEDVLVNYAN